MEKEFTGVRDIEGKNICVGDTVEIVGDTNSGHFKKFVGMVVKGLPYEGMWVEDKKDYMELGLKKYDYKII